MNVMTDNPLHQLTRGQREILRVLKECDWIYADAATRMQMPEVSVRTAVHRAIKTAGVRDRAGLAYLLGQEDALAAKDIRSL